jgi:importin-5
MLTCVAHSPNLTSLVPDSIDPFSPHQPADDSTDDTYPHVYEQALDRLACAVGGKGVLPAAFQHIPGMLASHDWKLRHAGLMAIASVAEGTSKVIALPQVNSTVTNVLRGDAK